MELSSNWQAEDSFDYSSSVQLYSESIPDDIAELLNEEKCFILNQQEDNRNNCFLKLTTPQSLNTTWTALGQCQESSETNSGVPRRKCVSITVISESKHIEVFVGEHEEYFASFSGKIMREYADSQICRTDIVLGKPQCIVKMVLKNTFDSCSIMVYGIYAKVCKSDGAQVNKPTGTFSSKKLDAILSDHGIKLSKEADLFKHFLQSYNDTSSTDAFKSLASSGGASLLSPMNPFGAAMMKNISVFGPKLLSVSSMSVDNSSSHAFPKNVRNDILVPASEASTSLPSNSSSNANLKSSISGHEDECPGAATESAAVVVQLSKGISHMDISPAGEQQELPPTASSLAQQMESQHIEKNGNESAIPVGGTGTLLNGAKPQSQKEAAANERFKLPLQLGVTNRDSNSRISVPNLNRLQSLPLFQNSNQICFNGTNKLESDSSLNIVSIFEKIIDEKLANFEEKLEKMIDNKLAEQTSQILEKLNCMERNSNATLP